MTEKEILEGNIKLTVFKSFPYAKIKPIIEFIESRGFICEFVDNGNIVFQEIRNGGEMNKGMMENDNDRLRPGRADAYYAAR